MAEALYSSGKHGLATEPGSLAGAVLRRLLLSESDLPEGIQFLPALFRLMAFLLFLPVAMLTLVRLGSGLPARALRRGAWRGALASSLGSTEGEDGGGRRPRSLWRVR